MATADQRRQQILKFAKDLEGAHYLWGAEALRPTRTESSLFAPVVLSLEHPEQSCFCAATQTDVDNVVYVCAGRFSRMTGGGPIAKPPADDEQLKTFIKQWGSKGPTAQYGWAHPLTPRMVKGKDIMDYRSHVDVTNKVVWGEGCDDTLHFDCGTFVRYVVQQVCGVNITGISKANLSAKMIPGTGKLMGRRLDPKNREKILPADILVWPGHVALATGDDNLDYIQADTVYRVAQAESAAEGVNVGTHRGQPTACIRLSDELLTFKP